jgi:mono/diheme cytochrome c family protein
MLRRQPALTGFFTAICLVVASFMLAGGASAFQSAPQKNPFPASEDSIKAGRAIYAKFCRNCHGLNGEGDGNAPPPGVKPANLVTGKYKHGGTDAELFKSIKQGIGPAFDMKAWGGELSDNDIWHTINFIHDLTARKAARDAAKKGTAAPKKK